MQDLLERAGVGSDGVSEDSLQPEPTGAVAAPPWQCTEHPGDPPIAERACKTNNTESLT